MSRRVGPPSVDALADRTSVAKVLESMGLAMIDVNDLDRHVASALDVGVAHVTKLTVEVIDYPIGTPSTHALLRCRGEAIAGRGGAATGDSAAQAWSIFVKVLQHPSSWKYIGLVPEAARDEVLNAIPWRLEIYAHQGSLKEVLPSGMRLPRLYDVHEIDDRHAALWMEDIDVDVLGWDVARFASAAELLGRLAARRPADSPSALSTTDRERVAGAALRGYVEARPRLLLAGPLDDDGTWAHPLVATAIEREGEHGLRADLLATSRHIDQWLDLLDSLPQTLVHGDASPQNLLVPRGCPGREPEFVVIDWGFPCPQAVGFDLGQLVIGLAHSGDLDAHDLPAIIEASVSAYVRGLRSEGDLTPTNDVRVGFIGSLVLRALFTMLPLELLGEPDSEAIRATFAQRVRLTRYLLDLAQELPH